MKPSILKNSILLTSALVASSLLSGCDSQTSNLSSDSISETVPTEIVSVEEATQSVTTSENSATNTTITKAGTYTFLGTIDPITVNVSKDEEVEIILDGVNITSSTTAPIYIEEAKDVLITLAKDSTNTIIDNRTSSSDSEDSPNAAIYSMSDLKIKGESKSSLIVEGNLNDGIASKDDLEIKEAIITVTAKDDGIRGKDSLEISEGIISVTAGGDGLKSDNEDDETKGVIVFEDSNVTISSGDDGIDAVQQIEFLSGTTTIEKSYEGVEAMNIIVRGGVVDITASDDGINVTDTDAAKVAITGGNGIEGGPGGGGEEVIDGSVDILGGTVIIHSDSDGFDSNGNATMTGGTLIIHGPTVDREGPIDVNGTFEVSGGTIIAIGAAGMAEVPDTTSTQNTLQINFTDTQSAGTEISIKDSSGKEIGSLVSEKTFASVTFSSADLQQGETYTLSFDEEVFEEITIDSSVTVIGAELKRQGGGQGGGRGEMNGGIDGEVAADAAIFGDMESGEMRIPPNVTLPENWDTMTEDEKHEFMEANKPEGIQDEIQEGMREGMPERMDRNIEGVMDGMPGGMEGGRPQ